MRGQETVEALHEPEREQPCPRSWTLDIGRWTLDVGRSSQKLPTFNFQRPTSNVTPPPERCSCWFMAPTHLNILEVFPFHEPRSAAVPAASCGGVPPPARTPGGTPGELAGEDACATFAGQFMVAMRDFEIVGTAQEGEN